MQIQPGMLRSIRYDLAAANLIEVKDIAVRLATSQTTVRRILRGESVRDTPGYALCRVCAKLPLDRDLDAREQGKLERYIQDHCVPVELAPAPVVPREPNHRRRAGRPPLAAVAVYIKFLHLRDAAKQKPVYRKFIARINNTVEAFDEFILIRSFVFDAVPARFTVIGKSNGIVDLQPVYPPRKERNTAHVVSDNAPTRVEHFETAPETLVQGAFTFVNAFQAGNEVVASVLDEAAARLTLTVDLSSLPYDMETLLSGERGGGPHGYHIRQTANGTERLRLLVQSSTGGVYLLDTKDAYAGTEAEPGWDPVHHRLLKNDRIEMRFPINWDAVL